MASLIDLVVNRMTPEIIQKLARLVGISSTNAKRAIDAIIPIQLYDLVSMGATEVGANRLLSLLKEHKGTESRARPRTEMPCSRRSMAMISAAASAAWRRPSAFHTVPPHP